MHLWYFCLRPSHVSFKTFTFTTSYSNCSNGEVELLLLQPILLYVDFTVMATNEAE